MPDEMLAQRLTRPEHGEQPLAESLVGGQGAKQRVRSSAVSAMRVSAVTARSGSALPASAATTASSSARPRLLSAACVPAASVNPARARCATAECTRSGTVMSTTVRKVNPAVVVSALTKTYDDLVAVDGVDFEVASGEVFGFLGPNGAGKSTTIKMLCTLVEPTAGAATVAGYDIVRQRDQVRRNIGLVFQDPTLDQYLTAEQNLRMHAELYGVPRAALRDRMTHVLEMVGLEDRRRARVATFSGGMKRRLEIARGLLHAPRVLFLDEPTVGLDPQTRS